jgi:hypothetical protein
MSVIVTPGVTRVPNERLASRLHELAERASVVDLRYVMRRLQFNMGIVVAGLIVFAVALVAVLLGAVTTEPGKRMTAVILLAGAGLFVTGILASISLIANAFAYERLRGLLVAEAQQEAEEDREILVQAVADISVEAMTGRFERKAIHAALTRAGAPDRATVLAAEVDRRAASKVQPS